MKITTRALAISLAFTGMCLTGLPVTAQTLYDHPTFDQFERAIAAAEGRPYVPGPARKTDPTFDQMERLVRAIKSSATNAVIGGAFLSVTNPVAVAGYEDGQGLRIVDATNGWTTVGLNPNMNGSGSAVIYADRYDPDYSNRYWVEVRLPKANATVEMAYRNAASLDAMLSDAQTSDSRPDVQAGLVSLVTSTNAFTNAVSAVVRTELMRSLQVVQLDDGSFHLITVTEE